MIAGAGFTKGNSDQLLPFMPIAAWLALGVMTIAWIHDRRCHWAWPVVGTACGAISALMFIHVFFFFIGAIPLALYLVYWHLWSSSKGSVPA